MPSDYKLDGGKITGKAGNPLARCLLGGQFTPFVSGYFLAVVFDVTDLLDHAQPEHIFRAFKFESDFKTLCRFFAPHNIADNIIFLVQDRDADADPLTCFQRTPGYEGQAAETDIA